MLGVHGKSEVVRHILPTGQNQHMDIIMVPFQKRNHLSFLFHRPNCACISFFAFIQDSLHPTHRCSLHGRCRCSLLLCGHTLLHSGRGWSSTGWSPSRSNRPWSPPGTGTASRQWDGSGGTRWKATRWRAQNYWSAELRCTSCSSGRALANTRCHRMGEPWTMEEEKGKRKVLVENNPNHRPVYFIA